MSQFTSFNIKFMTDEEVMNYLIEITNSKIAEHGTSEQDNN